MTCDRYADLFVLLRYSEQLQGWRKEFDAPWSRKKFLLFQYLLQQNRRLTEENRLVFDEKKKEMWRQASFNCFSTHDADQSVGFDFRLREFVTVTYGPTVVHVFPGLLSADFCRAIKT